MPAIKAGTVTEATIDDKVRRILRKAIQFGWLDSGHDQTDLSWSRYSLQSDEAALSGALESMVLLKNDGNLLPFDKAKVRTIAVIGPDAYPGAPVGGGSAQVSPFRSTSFLEGVSNYLGTSATVMYNRGLPTFVEMSERTNFVTAPRGGRPGLTVEMFDNSTLSGAPKTTFVAKHVNLGGGRDEGELNLDEVLAPHPTSSRWSGYFVAENSGTYNVFVQWNGERSGFRLTLDDKKVLDDWELARALVDQTNLQLTAGPHKVVLEHYKNDQLDRPRLRLGILPVQSFVDEEAKAIAKKADAVILAVGLIRTRRAKARIARSNCLRGKIS